MEKEKKRGLYVIYIVFLMFISLLLISSVSAGFFDWLKKITGEATQTVELNISVGVPRIITVYNTTTVTINTAPARSSVILNFTVYSPSGAGNLNHSSAKANVTKSGEDTRQNLSCGLLNSGGNYANYTCNITMWWWDGNGTWNIGAYIQDNQTNVAINTTQVQAVGAATGFAAGPAALTWLPIGAGATNQTSNNAPYKMNNTGNIVISNITINATNLRGETTSSLALWAGNFSVSWNTGGTPPAECGGTTMQASTFRQVTTANITKGNFTINDGTAQEDLYLCLKLTGTELTTQAYSTANESDWTVQIPDIS